MYSQTSIVRTAFSVAMLAIVIPLAYGEALEAEKLHAELQQDTNAVFRKLVAVEEPSSRYRVFIELWEASSSQYRHKILLDWLPQLFDLEQISEFVKRDGVLDHKSARRLTSIAHELVVDSRLDANAVYAAIIEPMLASDNGGIVVAGVRSYAENIHFDQREQVLVTLMERTVREDDQYYRSWLSTKITCVKILQESTDADTIDAVNRHRELVIDAVRKDRQVDAGLWGAQLVDISIPDAIPLLLKGLESDDRFGRMAAISGLQRIMIERHGFNSDGTSNLLGYRVDDPPDKRQEAVRRWKEQVATWLRDDPRTE